MSSAKKAKRCLWTAVTKRSFDHGIINRSASATGCVRFQHSVYVIVLKFMSIFMSRKMCYNILQNNYFSVETTYTGIFNSLGLININELFGFIKEFCNKVFLIFVTFCTEVDAHNILLTSFETFLRRWDGINL